MREAPKRLWWNGAASPHLHVSTVPFAGGVEYVRKQDFDELRAVLQGIIDLGGTMGSALYAETVDRAARRALIESKEGRSDG